MVTLVLLFVLFSIVTFFDLKYGIIPNSVTVSFVAAGWVLAFVNGGWMLLLSSIGVTIVGFCLLLLPYAMGGVGGGDVKFLAAIGSLTTIKQFFAIALIGFIIAAAVAVLLLLKHRKLKETLYSIFFFFKAKKLEGAFFSNVTFPLGPCISAGGILVILSQLLG